MQNSNNKNKIYAKDQHKQLSRYSAFGHSKYNDQFELLYLTLRGDEADLASSDGVLYKQISYSETIVKWLERCVELAARKPITRETIIQYINHIKNLTNTNIKMNNELIELLSEEKNIESLAEISQNYNNVKNHIINKTFLAQLTQICNELNLINTSEEYDRVSKAWAGFEINNPKWNFFKIALEFESKDLGNLIIGINFRGFETQNPKTFQDLKRLEYFRHSNEEWVWNEFPKYNNWGKEALIAIKNGEMAKILKEEIQKIIIVTEGLEM